MRFPVLCEPEPLSRTATKSAERPSRALQTATYTDAAGNPLPGNTTAEGLGHTIDGPDAVAVLMML